MKRFRGFVCLWGTLGTNTVLQRRNASAQFVYDIVEMTDCILEAINSSTQAYISALTGRLSPSISHDRLSDLLTTAARQGQKNTASHDQARQSRTGDGTWNAYRNISEYDIQVVVAEVPLIGNA